MNIESEPGELPLSGILVAEFCNVAAGPFCGMLLADMGADIIKIEPKDGDMLRHWPPHTDGFSENFASLNRGKRSIALDLKHAGDREIAWRIMRKADVVIENFRPGTMARLNLGYEAALKRNPKIIYCSISGYGQNGPSRDEPAMDLILQASSGVMSITGTEDGKRVRCGYSVADVTTGMFATIGILTALRTRDISGIGQYVDVSMFDSMISAMITNFMIYLGTGNNPEPLGTAYLPIVPYRAFATRDIDIAIAVGSEKLWRAFAPAIGHEELVDHPAYATNRLRVQNRGELEPLLIEIFRTDTMENWLAKLRAAGVPASPVRRFDEVVNDAQSTVRGMFPHLEIPGTGQVKVVGSPIKLSEETSTALLNAPRLGEHSRKTLAEWFGMDATELGHLQKTGVILQADKQRSAKD